VSEERTSTLTNIRCLCHQHGASSTF